MIVPGCDSSRSRMWKTSLKKWSQKATWLTCRLAAVISCKKHITNHQQDGKWLCLLPELLCHDVGPCAVSLLTTLSYVQWLSPPYPACSCHSHYNLTHSLFPGICSVLTSPCDHVKCLTEWVTGCCVCMPPACLSNIDASTLTSLHHAIATWIALDRVMIVQLSQSVSRRFDMVITTKGRRGQRSSWSKLVGASYQDQLN